MKIDFDDDDFEVIENPQKIQGISSSGEPSFIVHYGNIWILISLIFTFRLDSKEKRAKLFGYMEQ